MSEQRSPQLGKYAWADLTDKEQTILSMCYLGKKRIEIARSVDLKKSSIDKMLSNEQGARSIYNKIGVKGLVEAVQWYEKNCPSLSTKVNQGSLNETPITNSVSSFNLLGESYIVDPIRIHTLLFWSLFLILFLPLWIAHPADNKTEWNEWTRLSFLSPLTTGVYGLFTSYRNRQVISRKWLHSLLCLFTGLVTWSIGQMIWVMSYVVFKASLPYPSIVDVSFVFSACIWLIGVFLLKDAYSFPKHSDGFVSWILSILLFLLVLIIMLSVRGYEISLNDDPLRFLLDLYYPAITGISTSIIIEIIYHSEGPRIRRAMVYLLIGIVLRFLADTCFGFTTLLSSDDWLVYHVGNWIDFTFGVSFWLVGIGLLYLFSSSQIRLKK